MRSFFKSMVFFLLLSLQLSAQASPVEINPSLQPSVEINQVQFLADPSGVLSLADVKSEAIARQFQNATNDAKQLNFGFTNNTYWLKLTAKVQTPHTSKYILEIPYLGLEDIVFYTPSGTEIHTGLLQPVGNKPLYSRFYAFPIVLTELPQSYFFKIKSNYALSIPLKITSERQFFYEEQTFTFVQALYFGGLVALAIYNLLIFTSLRDKNYFYYFFFTSVVGIGMFTGNGFSRTYLWPTLIQWDQVAQSTLFSLAGCIGVRFSQAFLKTRKLSKGLHQSLSVLAYVYLLLAFLIPLAPIGKIELMHLYVILFCATVPMCILLCIAAVKAIQSNISSAKYFLMSWSCLWLGALIASLRGFDLVPTNAFTGYALQIGSALEMLLLSFALANRIQSERLMKEEAQKEALLSKEQALHTLKDSEARLERLVKARTDYLQVLLDNEKNVRAQYVRFGAMISHEFRNPLGIIETQLELLKREFSRGINHFEKRYKTLISATQRLAILFERWLQSDRLNHMMEVIQPKEIELNEWLSDLVEKYKNYQPNHKIFFAQIPKSLRIQIDEQLIQTAVMNLIDNACKYSRRGSSVRIATTESDDEIGISVTDEGIGIDRGHHEAIFSEYFRVNENSTVRGIGLGLAFVKKIIELHQGRIEVSSRLGEGTRMLIWLSKTPCQFTQISNRH